MTDRPSDDAVGRRVRALLAERESEDYAAKLVNAIYVGERADCWDYLVVTVEGCRSNRNLVERHIGLVKPHCGLEDAILEDGHDVVAAREFPHDEVPRLANALAASYARVDAVFRASSASDGTIEPQVLDATRGEAV